MIRFYFQTCIVCILFHTTHAETLRAAVTITDTDWILDKDEDKNGLGDFSKRRIERGSQSCYLREVLLNTGTLDIFFRYFTCNAPAHLNTGKAYHGLTLSSLGMWYRNGTAGWYGNGFIDVLLNKTSLNDYKAEIQSHCNGNTGTIQCHWNTENACISIKVTAYSGDDKLFLVVEIVPKTEIKDINVKFLCYPSTFGIRTSEQSIGRDRWVATPRRTIQHSQTISLSQDEYSILYYDRIWDPQVRSACGGACGLLFLPGESISAQVNIQNYEIYTSFTYPPETRVIHYVLWPSMNISNKSALNKLRGYYLEEVSSVANKNDPLLTGESK